MSTQEIFDQLVYNAPSYLEGVEIMFEDAQRCKRLMKKENLSFKEAADIVYEEIEAML